MRYKHRTLLHPLGSLVLLTVLLLSGCDRFSLLEQFQFVGKGGPDSLTLTPSMSTLRPGESCELYPAGGTPPYYFQ